MFEGPDDSGTLIWEGTVYNPVLGPACFIRVCIYKLITVLQDVLTNSFLELKRKRKKKI